MVGNRNYRTTSHRKLEIMEIMAMGRILMLVANTGSNDGSNNSSNHDNGSSNAKSISTTLLQGPK